MTRLRTPIVTVITGEGGSGGALAIAVGDVVIALENAVYSVIRPEGCAAILWRTTDEAPTAALAMRMTAADQQRARRHRRRRPGAGRGRPDRPGRDGPPAARRSSSTELDGARGASRSTSSSKQRYRRYRALGAYTEAETRRSSRRRAVAASADRLRDLLDPGRRAGRRRRPPSDGATSRRPARRSDACPIRQPPTATTGRLDPAS